MTIALREKRLEESFRALLERMSKEKAPCDDCIRADCDFYCPAYLLYLKVGGAWEKAVLKFSPDKDHSKDLVSVYFATGGLLDDKVECGNCGRKYNLQMSTWRSLLFMGVQENETGLYVLRKCRCGNILKAKAKKREKTWNRKLKQQVTVE